MIRALERILRTLIGAALLGAIAAPGAADAVGASHGWSEPIKVSPAVAHNVDWFPSVAADDSDHVHIVWSTGPDEKTARPEDSGQLEYTQWDGRSWSKPTDLALIWYGYVLRNSIAAGPDGRVHLLVKSWADPGRPKGMEGQDIYYMSANPQDAASYRGWSTPVRLNTGQLAYYAAIALDSKGIIHALWTEVDSSGQFGLFYAHSSDGGTTWSKRVALEDDQPVWWYRAQMKIDAQDQIHVVYELGGQDTGQGKLSFGVTRAAVYAQSIDSGQTWARRVFRGTLVDSSPDTGPIDASAVPQQPAIGVDGRGNRLVVYREPRSAQLLYRQSTDGSNWTAPVRLPGIAAGVTRPYDVFDMVTDSAGHVHLAAIGYPTGSPVMSVLHSEWDGQAWSRADVIAASPPYPEYPRLAISKGNQLHLVWFSGDKETTDRTPVGIWYSTLTTSAPTVIAQASGRLSPPTPIAQSVTNRPTAAPLAPPTPEALPVQSRGSYESRTSSSGIQALRDLPGMPLYAGLALALIILGIVSVRYLRGIGITKV